MTVVRRAAITDPGQRRRRNEDAYVAEPPLFAVADGMGGAQAGEIASRIAAAVLRTSSGTGGEKAIVGLIEEANRKVYEAAASDAAHSGMGTTITAALVEGGAVRIGHVGDSRAYRIREGRLEQLTEDHSLVAELVRSGKLSQEEADAHPQRSVITRALGTDPQVDVDTFTVATRPGDLFMLCSDGLTSMVADEVILGILKEHRTNLEHAGRALVEAANRGGGEDNITVVLFEIGMDSDGETTTISAAPEEPQPAPAGEEDTLTELEAVPVVGDTMLVTREELEAPAAELPRRRRLSRTTILLGFAAVVAVLAGLLVWGLSRSYFVGAQPNGHVAVYQGFPWNIAGGVRLYRLRYESPLLAGQLTQAERRKLFDHDLRSYDAALRAVRRYEAEVVP